MEALAEMTGTAEEVQEILESVEEAIESESVGEDEQMRVTNALSGSREALKDGNNDTSIAFVGPPAQKEEQEEETRSPPFGL